MTHRLRSLLPQRRGALSSRRLAWLPWVPLVGALWLGGCATTDAPPAGATSQVAAAPPGVGAAPSVPRAAPEAPRAAGVAAAPSEPAAAPTPIDPLRPEARIDIDAAAAQADLWARLRRGFAMPDLEGDLVRDREQWYASRPEYVARMTGRSSRYLFHVVEELERRGMPAELALLPFVESAFNPQAMSTAKASGMWQFIPSTGRDFRLRQNIFRDDRRDVLASTRAALDYLSRLHAQFGDWHLALAAYNWGEGSVQRAIAKHERAGLPTDYASLKMPDETRLYVPKLQAVKNIVARPDAFGLVLPAIANHPYFLSVPIERDIDVEVAVRLAGVSLDEFRTLNPQMNKPVILAAGTPQLLLPYDNAARFVHGVERHRGALATWTAWVAPRNLHPAEAAREVGMSEDALREVNRIPSRMLVKAGSTLLVPRHDAAHAEVSGHVADNATMALVREPDPLRRTVFRAGRRDSVAAVARRFGVGVQQVAHWNHVAPTAVLRPGQAVVVYTPVERPALLAVAYQPAPAPAPAAAPYDAKAATRAAALAAVEAQAAAAEAARRGRVPAAVPVEPSGMRTRLAASRHPAAPPVAAAAAPATTQRAAQFVRAARPAAPARAVAGTARPAHAAAAPAHVAAAPVRTAVATVPAKPAARGAAPARQVAAGRVRMALGGH